MDWNIMLDPEMAILRLTHHVVKRDALFFVSEVCHEY
jgi:hypothetical protein